MSYSGTLLATKRNKLLIHVKTWVNSKIIMLSEGSQFKNGVPNV